MLLDTYKESYKDSLATLIHLYFLETHTQDYIGDINKAKKMIDELLLNKSIYVLVDSSSNSSLVGFIITYINDQYGMTKAVVVNEYMYIKPEYRSSRAIAYLYFMLGTIAKDYNYDVLGTTFLSSSNTRNNELVGAVPIATVYKFPIETIDTKYNKYKKRLKYE